MVIQLTFHACVLLFTQKSEISELATKQDIVFTDWVVLKIGKQGRPERQGVDLMTLCFKNDVTRDWLLPSCCCSSLFKTLFRSFSYTYFSFSIDYYIVNALVSKQWCIVHHEWLKFQLWCCFFMNNPLQALHAVWMQITYLKMAR